MNQRLYYMDAVRAFALLLGVVFHASLSFMPMFIGWAVMDVSTSDWVAGFVLVAHSFRMELFFLVAGFFTRLKFHKTPVQNVVYSRLIRLALPFVLGWFLLRAMLVHGWTWGAQSMQGQVDIYAAMQAGLKSVLTLDSNFLTGTHLWFLYYLILATSITIILRATVYYFGLHQSRLQAVFCRIRERSRIYKLGLISVLVIFTAVCLYFMNHWGVDTPDKSLLPHWPVLLIYTVFFAFGWALNTDQELISDFAKLSVWKALVCVIAIFSCLKLSPYEAYPFHPEFFGFKAAYAVSYACMMWSLVALTIGFFKLFFSKFIKVIAYLAEASYWIYLIHLPIVIWLQITFAELQLIWSVKLIGIVCLTLLSSLALYELFIRYSFVGRFLNGKNREQRNLAVN